MTETLTLEIPAPRLPDTLDIGDIGEDPYRLFEESAQILASLALGLYCVRVIESQKWDPEAYTREVAALRKYQVTRKSLMDMCLDEAPVPRKD